MPELDHSRSQMSHPAISTLVPERAGDVARTDLAGTISWRCPQRWRHGSWKRRPGALQPPRGRLSDPQQAHASAAQPPAQRGAPRQGPQGCGRDLCATRPSPALRVLAGHLCFDLVPPDQRHTSISLAMIYSGRRGQHSGEGSCASRDPRSGASPSSRRPAVLLHCASTAQHGRSRFLASFVLFEGGWRRQSHPP